LYSLSRPTIDRHFIIIFAPVSGEFSRGAGADLTVVSLSSWTLPAQTGEAGVHTLVLYEELFVLEKARVA